MQRRIIYIIIAAVAALILLLLLVCRCRGISAESDPRVRVFEPDRNELVESPLTVTGEARGPWFFEASFPVRLLDEDGEELAVVPAQAEGEWMTEEFVPFSAVLTFDEPAGGRGTLVLEKDNPSGLPEDAAEVRIPVRFR